MSSVENMKIELNEVKVRTVSSAFFWCQGAFENQILTCLLNISSRQETRQKPFSILHLVSPSFSSSKIAKYQSILKSIFPLAKGGKTYDDAKESQIWSYNDQGKLTGMESELHDLEIAKVLLA